MGDAQLAIEPEPPSGAETHTCEHADDRAAKRQATHRIDDTAPWLAGCADRIKCPTLPT